MNSPTKLSKEELISKVLNVAAVLAGVAFILVAWVYTEVLSGLEEGENVVTGVTLTMDMPAEAASVVGQNFGAEIFLGRNNLTGQITAYLEDTTFIDGFLDETEFELLLQLDTTSDEATPTITLYLPRIKLGGADVALTASFAGDRLDLTDANLLRVWLGNPLMTLKVIAGIHWEALLLWAKGIRYLGRPRSGAHPRKQKAAA